MQLLATLATESDAFRYKVYRRDDGLLRIDQEKRTEVRYDEHALSYWLDDKLGLFGTEEDVRTYLNAATPRPMQIWPE